MFYKKETVTDTSDTPLQSACTLPIVTNNDKLAEKSHHPMVGYRLVSGTAPPTSIVFDDKSELSRSYIVGRIEFRQN